MSRFNVYAAIVSALLAAGCAELPDGNGLYQEPPSEWTVEQNNNRLLTIEHLLKGGKISTAKQQADLVNIRELLPEQKARFNLIAAQILLSFGEAEQAISQLAGVDVGTLGIDGRIKFYQSQAFAYALAGNLLESAKARIGLDSLLANPTEKHKNQALIMESLGLLPDALVRKGQNEGRDIPEWISIAKILASRNRDAARFNSALAGWRAANPQHPANIYLSKVVNMDTDSSAAPSAIAVLLPESGPFSDASKAVKAGFLAAHSRDNSGKKPQVRFYDTEGNNAGELYRKAVSEGANLVVGPLNKESIQQLSSETLSVPVLALNHVPGLNKPNLYQFGLSPMDDVAELSQKAAQDGHKKALMLMVESEQGKRISSFFSKYWPAQNGTVIDKQVFNPKANDFSPVIKKLLNIKESSAKAMQTPSYFPAGKIKPGVREDADVIFLNAYSQEGRAMVSQLRSIGGEIPVYAMPTIYSGANDTFNDNALNNVVFCDMPWLFNSAYNGDLSMSSMKDIWSQFPGTYLRLVPMGIDAYHLGMRVSSIMAEPYSGATGNLSLVEDNRIKRNLVCAKFVVGKPELIGFSHSPAENNLK